MNTFIPATSPLFAYSVPSPADQVPIIYVPVPDENADRSSNDLAANLPPGTEVELNFTGVGIHFDMTLSASNSTLQPTLKVNNTATPWSASVSANTSFSLSNLPRGTHQLRLTLPGLNSSLSLDTPNSTTNMTFRGATIAIGAELSHGSKNVTIDDTAWREWRVFHTPGWNMVEGHEGESNWIDEVGAKGFTSSEEVVVLLPLNVGVLRIVMGGNRAQTAKSAVDAPILPRGLSVRCSTRFRPFKENYNISISWTEQADAAISIFFDSEAVWVYGQSGGPHGRYEVLVDNTTQGVYNASSCVATVFNSLLYFSSDLTPGGHNRTLRNVEQGKRLTFDRLVAVSDLQPLEHLSSPSSASTTPPFATTSSASTSIPSAARADQTSALSRPTVVGLSVGLPLLALLVLALLAWWYRNRCRKARQGQVVSNGKGDPSSFWHWPSLSTQDRQSFQPLPSPDAAVRSLPLPETHKHTFLSFPSPPPSPAAVPLPKPNPVAFRIPALPQDKVSFLKLNRSKSRIASDEGWPQPESTSVKVSPFESALRREKGQHRQNQNQNQSAMTAAISGSDSPLADLMSTSHHRGGMSSFLPRLSLSGLRSMRNKDSFSESAKTNWTFGTGGSSDSPMRMT